MEIDFTALKTEAIEAIQKNKIMILATSADEKVTARTMSCVHDGLNIYFQTSKDSVKYNQMKTNKHVALCCSNMSIEGIAHFLGQSLDENKFIEKYRIRHNGSFNTYSFLKTSYVVEVRPERITFWKYSDGQPYTEILDLVHGTAVRELFDISDKIDLPLEG